MFDWIRKSFYRQVMAILIVGGFTITAVYGLFDYSRERDQLHNILRADADHLVDTLSLVIADDVFYRRYFELWNRLNAVYQRHRVAARRGQLYTIREISVTDNAGLVLGHTNPRQHPLLKPDGQQGLFDEPSRHDGSGQTRWLDGTRPTLLIRYPIHYSNEKIGDITLTVDPRPMLAMQRQLVVSYLAYEFIFLVILLLTARFLARWLARPLEQVSKVLPLLGTGSVQLPELRARQDELQCLATAIEDADRRIHAAHLAARNRQEELEERVQERTREIESFTYSVSHDLRSPLRAMDGFSLALLEDHADKLDEEGRNYLQRIRAAASRMGDIIDDLLMLSRVNRQSLSLTSVDLSRMANDIIAELREQEPKREVEVRIEAGLRARGDARLLRIALTNLLGNAWKYGERTEGARIEFRRGQHRGKTVFMISDNGAGFDMQYVDKLFGAFQRLHGRDEYEGTGIGLTIVQRIVHRHGGEIWAEGTPGKGATFYFHLGGDENAPEAT